VKNRLFLIIISLFNYSNKTGKNYKYPQPRFGHRNRWWWHWANI